jgi:hypothetical protein
LGIPILAIALLFVSRKKETLPRFIRWFDNNELHLRADGDDGLSGPDYIRSKWKDPTGWLARFNWLALRNPVNYFQYAVLGFQVQQGWKYKSENNNVGTHSYNKRGIRKTTLYNPDGKKYWEWYAVLPIYGLYHFRARLGYKIGDITDLKPGEWVQWVFAITPIKKLKPLDK